MENSTKVSVIITTYKRPVSIVSRAVESVRRQTLKNFELFVVNDYPENSKLSAEIESMIESLHDDRIKYVSYECNKGACYARNYGASLTKGEFLAFLDDDDEFCENKLELQLNGFRDEIAMVYSPFYEYGYTENSRVIQRSCKEGNVLRYLVEKNILGGCSMVMIRKKAFDEVKGFDVNLLASQDYDLWFRIASNYEVAYVDTPLTKRYLSCDSISINPTKKIQGWMLFDEKHSAAMMKYPEEYNAHLTAIVEQAVEMKQISFAYKIWKKAVNTKLLSVKNIVRPVRGGLKIVRNMVRGRDI